MDNLYTISFKHSPNDAQIAIVPVNEYGSLGLLNEMVLKSYGYDLSILEGLDLKKGFDLFALNGKPILFVVTVAGSVDTAELLRKNLFDAITNNLEYLLNRKVWLPLLGTGAGGLSYKNSWQIIRGILEELKKSLLENNTEFIIALPDDKNGQVLWDLILDEPDEQGKAEGNTLSELMKSSESKFYLVGTSWEGDDQSDRFYEQELWETGYDKKYSGIINSIRPGDFLIQKSAYSTKDGGNYLRFKGFAVVIENPGNGTLLNVRWIITNKKIDLEDLGYYRSTIAEPSPSDLMSILGSGKLKVHTKKIYDAIGNPLPKKPILTQIAGLVSDSEEGTDFLDISSDVNAFALVLAAKSFEPPLAIALLGRWGSGKSFFMKKLRQEIEVLSHSPNPHFCKGVAHVHFNAWSYMDANLWAGITTRIFDGLHDYIRNDNQAKRYVAEIEKKLTEDLSATKEQLSGLNDEKEQLKNQLKQLNEKKEKAKGDLEKKIEEIRLGSLKAVLNTVDEEFKVEEKLIQALRENASVAQNIEEFKKIVPEEYWQKPEEIYAKARSVPAMVRMFFLAEKRKANIIWLVVSIILFVVVPIVLLACTNFFSSTKFIFSPSTWFVLSIMGTLYVRAVVIYKKVKPFFAKLWKIKEDYLRAKDSAVFEFNQHEKALIFEIENNKNELGALNGQINNISIVKSTIEFKIGNALSTQALHDFIEKKCNSDEYKKHLGLVSIIRNDFEVLSNLFKGHHKETDKIKDGKTFSELFERPLERIILYIDDLDRCPEERVVEVLEAVNLLMAFPLFVVIVGVDPVWVKNALITKHKMQFNFEDKNYEGIDPNSYMEKIFQIPFHLKQAENGYIRNMLKGLSQQQTIIAAIPEAIGAGSANGQQIRSEPGGISESSTTERNLAGSSPNPVSLNDQETIEALSFTQEEIDMIQNMSVIIGNSPRLIKRYVNIYRIIKSHDYISKGAKISNTEVHIILFILALYLGKHKKLLGILNEFLNDANQERTLSLHIGPLSTIVRDENQTELKDELLKLMLENCRDLLSETAASINRHVGFIKRFAYYEK